MLLSASHMGVPKAAQLWILRGQLTLVLLLLLFLPLPFPFFLLLFLLLVIVGGYGVAWRAADELLRTTHLLPQFGSFFRTLTLRPFAFNLNNVLRPSL